MKPQSNDIFGDGVAHDIDKLFEGHRFEYRLFEWIKRDYLLNVEKQCKHYFHNQRWSPLLVFHWHLYLTLAHSKGQGQGHVHFDCEYLANDDNITIAPNIMSHVGFRLVNLELTLTYIAVNLAVRTVFRKYFRFLVFRFPANLAIRTSMGMPRQRRQTYCIQHLSTQNNNS